MSQTATHREARLIAADPEAVMQLLTEPDAIARWAPLPFDVDGLESPRLRSGTLAYVRGGLAGRRVEFEVSVAEASDTRLALTACGPVHMDVEYRVEALDHGSHVEASIALKRGKGLFGGLMAGATGALLSGGALRAALGLMADELERAPLCAAA
jgi:hypothetical protein